jgi:hypothetical protein
MEKWLKQYGPVVGLMLGSERAVAISGPTEVIEVLRKEEFLGRPENANFRQENFNRKLGKFNFTLSLLKLFKDSENGFCLNGVL